MSDQLAREKFLAAPTDWRGARTEMAAERYGLSLAKDWIELQNAPPVEGAAPERRPFRQDHR
jgi:hypothetical protein